MKYRKNKKRVVFFEVYNHIKKKHNINEEDIIELWYKELPNGFKGFSMYIETYNGTFKSYSL